MENVKFRVWHSPTKSFLYWGMNADGTGAFISPPAWGQVSMKKSVEMSEQWSGRKDSAGEDLYVGDKCDVDGTPMIVTYSMRWTEFRFIGANSVGWYHSKDIRRTGHIHQ